MPEQGIERLDDPAISTVEPILWILVLGLARQQLSVHEAIRILRLICGALHATAPLSASEIFSNIQQWLDSDALNRRLRESMSFLSL